MDLKEFREHVLRQDRPDELLSLADIYLRDMELKGNLFVLPREHMIVKPVLEFYAHDLEGWVKFVKGVRDRLPIRGREFNVEVQKLLRLLQMRLAQKQRRERLEQAILVAIQRGYIKDTPEEKQRYANRCTQVWKVRKDTLLKAVRQNTAKGRVSVEEREELLEKFWRQIDEEIAKGEVPEP